MATTSTTSGTPRGRRADQLIERAHIAFHHAGIAEGHAIWRAACSIRCRCRMSAVVGVLMLVLILALGAAQAWSAGYLESILKGVVLGLGVSAWLGVALYLIGSGAA